MPSLSIVVPVYNSATSLPKLAEVLAVTLPKLAAEYELILINDGSRDKSWQVITELLRTYPWIRAANLMRNYGQHNALLCGIRAARYDVVVTIDDDLQHPPEEIRKLLDKLAEGYEVVYGAPEHEQHGLWRDLASQTTKMVLSGSMGVDVARNVSAFRAFRTYLRDAFAHFEGPFVSIDVLLTWATTQFATVTVRHDERKYGVSNYTLRKLIIHAVNMITGFSTLPLQLASIIGFLFTLFGIVVLVYVIGRYLVQGVVVQGFAFLASIIALFSGAQLFALGIIGEYLARMHFRSMQRPTYVNRSGIVDGTMLDAPPPRT